MKGLILRAVTRIWGLTILPCPLAAELGQGGEWAQVELCGQAGSRGPCGAR